MKRNLAAMLAIGALGALAPAQALAGDPLNEYEGRVERDSSTYIGFDLAKKHGETKVNHVKAKLHYSCTNGDGGTTFADGLGSLKLKHKHFSGRLAIDESMLRGGSKQANYKLTGKLGRKGSAKGSVEGEFFLHPAARRGGSVRCYSGGVDWKAKRGADLLIIIRPVRVR